MLQFVDLEVPENKDRFYSLKTLKYRDPGRILQSVDPEVQGNQGEFYRL